VVEDERLDTIAGASPKVRVVACENPVPVSLISAAPTVAPVEGDTDVTVSANCDGGTTGDGDVVAAGALLVLLPLHPKAQMAATAATNETNRPGTLISFPPSGAIPPTVESVEPRRAYSL
jgi:hypothetical protein